MRLSFWFLLQLLFAGCSSSKVPFSTRSKALKLLKTLVPATTIVSCILGGRAAAKVSLQGSGKSGLSAEEFRAEFPYSSPRDFLNYIRRMVPGKGNARDVLAAMDEFAVHYPMYKLTPFKANILATQVKKRNPLQVIEIGSFFGYSAVCLLLSTSPQCHVTCLEANEANLEVMNAVLELAFGRDSAELRRISIKPGISSATLRSFEARSRAFDFVFLDHDKSSYLPDLRLLEQQDLLAQECVVVADNVIFPGAPDFMGYITAGGGGPAEAKGSYRWSTTVEKAPFERVGFETNFEPKEDGMSISVGVRVEHV